VVWLLQAFFRSIPVEIEEMAQIDGCSRLRAIIKILLPLSTPGLTATGIFVFIGAWNHYIYATILTEFYTKPFTIRLAQFIGEDQTVYEKMYPATIIGSLPILILVLFFQKYIIQGLTEGGINF
jgi:multiple sugar transport system permease protein